MAAYSRTETLSGARPNAGGANITNGLQGTLSMAETDGLLAALVPALRSGTTLGVAEGVLRPASPVSSNR